MLKIAVRARRAGARAVKSSRERHRIPAQGPELLGP